MILPILVIWGCIPEIKRGCIDMTNSSSTYLSIAIEAVVGTLISWRIYKIQKNATIKQEETLGQLINLEESHDKVLKSIEQFQNHRLDRKIDSIIEQKIDE
jgi:hypothetical protein